MTGREYTAKTIGELRADYVYFDLSYSDSLLTMQKMTTPQHMRLSVAALVESNLPVADLPPRLYHLVLTFLFLVAFSYSIYFLHHATYDTYL